MEFKTSQGGETTLVFDDAEQTVVKKLAEGGGGTEEQITRLIARMRQANPLMEFDALVRIAFPPTAGVVPTKPRRKAADADPVTALEADIRRRLSTTASQVGSTSQTVQAEAVLISALATCLQTQALKSVGDEIINTLREMKL